MSVPINKRLEAVSDALLVHLPTNAFYHGCESPCSSSPDELDSHLAEVALAAADAVMFDEASIERAAIALGVKQYPMIDGLWDDVDAEFKDKCREQARAVVAVLKGAGDE